MAVPEDSDAVLAAVRLGWYMAEVRGRNRPGAHPGSPLKLPKRTDHALPLEMERTAPELRIEAQAVLKALADQAGVDWESSGVSFARAVDRSAKALATASGGPSQAPARAGEPAKAADPAKAGEPAKAADPAKAGEPAKEAAPAETAGGADGGAPAGPGPAAGLAGAVRWLAGAAKGFTDAAKAGGPGGAPKTPAKAGPGTVAGDWDSLEDLIYRFDAHVQDTLAAQSVTVACGYQLGRALSECYWALDPSAGADGWASWSFLLGKERCSEIGRLVGRLSGYFHPYTSAAIAGSVQVWQNVARSTAWRDEAYPKLYDQIRGWYQLILLKQDPTTLIQPYQLLKNYRLVLRTLRGFWVQLLLAALAAGAVAVFAWLLTKPGVSSAVKTLLATLGIAGFSVAGLAAKVKNESQALLKRLKQDAYTDLISLAITTAPLPPRSVQAPKSGLIPPMTRKAKMTSMMRQRSITPITPA
jgi:hypothetical protein